MLPKLLADILRHSVHSIQRGLNQGQLVSTLLGCSLNCEPKGLTDVLVSFFYGYVLFFIRSSYF